MYKRQGVDGENGNYDFLIFNDVDFDHPEVIEELKRWGAGIAQTLDADGIRLDALKPVSYTQLMICEQSPLPPSKETWLPLLK